MDELPVELRALIEAARPGESPTAAERARAHAGLGARLAVMGLAAPPAPGPSASMPPAAAGGAGLGLGAKLAGLSLVVAGIAGVAFLRGAPDAPAPARDGAAMGAAVATESPALTPVAAVVREPGPRVVRAHGGAPTTPVAEPRAAPLPVAAAAPVPTAASPSPDAGPPRRFRGDAPPSTRPAPARPARAALADPRASRSVGDAAPHRTVGDRADEQRDGSGHEGLGRELALVSRARSALRRDDAAAALVALRTHASRFPEGVLGQERDGLYVLALCADGQQAAGRARAARFLSRNPSSVWAPRVRAACQGEK